MELYNEELTDLLSTEPGGEDRRLRLLEDRSGVNVQGLEEYMVKSAAEIYQARLAARRRRLAVWRGCWLSLGMAARPAQHPPLLSLATAPLRCPPPPPSEPLSSPPPPPSPNPTNAPKPRPNPTTDPGPRHRQAPHRRDAAQQALLPLALHLHGHHPHAGGERRDAGGRDQDGEAVPGGPGGVREHLAVRSGFGVWGGGTGRGLREIGRASCRERV